MWSISFPLPSCKIDRLISYQFAIFLINTISRVTSFCEREDMSKLMSKNVLLWLRFQVSSWLKKILNGVALLTRAFSWFFEEHLWWPLSDISRMVTYSINFVLFLMMSFELSSALMRRWQLMPLTNNSLRLITTLMQRIVLMQNLSHSLCLLL